MNDQVYRAEIERKILTVLQEQLESEEMKTERAKEIAQSVLEILQPHMSSDQVYAVIPMLVERFPELSQIFFDSYKDHEEQVKIQVTHDVDALIEQGNIDGAADLLTATLHPQDQRRGLVS